MDTLIKIIGGGVVTLVVTLVTAYLVKYLGNLGALELKIDFLQKHLKVITEEEAAKLNAIEKAIKAIKIKMEAEEEVRLEYEKKRADQTLFQNYSAWQQLVFQEIEKLIFRIDEIFSDRAEEQYELNSKLLLSATEKHPDYPHPLYNRKVTTIYRFYRLLAAFVLYKNKTSSFLKSPKAEAFDWYVDVKIKAVIAGDKFRFEDPSPLLWRDNMDEIGDLMIELSSKWGELRIANFESYKSIVNQNSEMMMYTSIDEFFSVKSDRLAFLGIYLIDLFQDVQNRTNYENNRIALLKYLKVEGYIEQELYGNADMKRMNLNELEYPRNYISPHYQVDRNYFKYTIQKNMKNLLHP